MSNMAAPSNLMYFGIYCCVYLVGNVCGILMSKLHVSYETPPDSVLIHVSSLGSTPSLVREGPHSLLFYLNAKGELKTNSAVNHLLGEKIDLVIKSDALSTKEEHLHIFIADSQSFSFFQHQYFATIKENSPRHTQLDVLGDLSFKCDINVSFKFASGECRKFYLKQSKNGALCGVEIFSNGPLDREDTDSYSCAIEAKAADGRTAQAIVLIHIQDENDQVPKFDQSIYLINITPNVSIGTHVISVHAVDKDIGSISYQIEGTNDFHINSISGEIFIANSVQSVSDQVFKAIATDQGGLKSSSKVQVSIIHVPSDLKFESEHHVFKRAVNRIERTFEAYENEGKNKPLFSIASQSFSGVEQYQIVDSSVDIFQVDTRGNVFVKENENLDYEEMEHRSVSMMFNITNTNYPAGKI